MKKIIYALALLLAAGTSTAEAQFLKKLKEKAEKTVKGQVGPISVHTDEGKDDTLTGITPFYNEYAVIDFLYENPDGYTKTASISTVWQSGTTPEALMDSLTKTATLS